MPSTPSAGPWAVETPGPSDRGLVARLLEDVVAVDATVAPAVAERRMRPAHWLQQPRPEWTGVVVAPGVEPRTVVGYAAVVPDADGGRRLGAVLVAPGWTDRGVEDALVAAAGPALAGPADAPPPVTDDLGLEIAPVTLPAQRVPGRRGRAGLVGAAAIALAGTLGVLAVQVGVGPLGAVLPFLAPDEDARPASGSDPATGVPPATDAPTPVALDVSPGATLAPSPTAPAGPVVPPDQDGQPGDQPDPGTAPPPPPPPSPEPDAPGLTSALLDPVVAGVVSTVDGITGDALSPLTATVEETADGATDLLDGAVDLVVGLLPAQKG